jgi:UDP-N-acetylglucosamine 2-epimerase (non-hydrolysing)
MSTSPVVGVAFGTRSEIVQLAPVVRALESAKIAYRLFSTGQHRDLLKPALRFFGLTPDHDLDVMREEQAQTELLAAITDGMTRRLREDRPTLLLVEGGTASAFGSALGAFLAGVPVGHVDAGLRSFDRGQPFPEETYRTLVSDLAGWHFCPTNAARDNLNKEGIESKRLFITGSPGVDATLRTRERLAAEPSLGLPLPLETVPERFVLVTCHRHENLAGLDGLVSALRELADARTDLHVVWPVHPNPVVVRATTALLGHPRIHLTEPVDYPTMLRLIEACYVVASDSGSIQHETPEFKKPLVLLRTVSDRPELVEQGGALLVGTDPRRVTAAVSRLFEDRTYYDRMASVANPFGDGKAGLRVVRMLERTHFTPP